jgi:cell division protein FtsL
MSQALPREWFGASIRNDGLNREKARFRLPSILTYLAAVALPLAALLIYTWQGVHVIRIGYEIDQLRRTHQALQAERGSLEVELASLQNLGAVETLAMRDLGMVYPEPGQVVVVRTRRLAEESPRGTSPPEETGRPKENRLLVFLRSVTEAM